MKPHALLLAAALAFPTMALAQTQSFSTKAGPVQITPVYHATARITAGGDTIYIDPAKPAKIDDTTKYLALRFAKGAMQGQKPL